MLNILTIPPCSQYSQYSGVWHVAGSLAKRGRVARCDFRLVCEISFHEIATRLRRCPLVGIVKLTAVPNFCIAVEIDDR